jgi:hypothetical protein
MRLALVASKIFTADTSAHRHEVTLFSYGLRVSEANPSTIVDAYGVRRHSPREPRIAPP